MLKTLFNFTRPTPVRQDAPLHGQCRSKRGDEAYPLGYVEEAHAVRTRLGDVLSILLDLDFLLRDPHHFFRRRHALRHLHRAFLLQCDHPFGDRRLFDCR